MTTPHPPPGTLAAFVEGRLTRAELQTVVAHLDGCAECRATIDAANEAFHEEGITAQPPATNRWWLAVAAAAMLALLVTVPYALQRRAPLARIAALLPRDARPVEARLSGAFPWAPYRGPERGPSTRRDTASMKLIGLAGELNETAERAPSADAQHAAGVAMLVVDDPSAAIARLRAAVEHAPNDPAIWSDLAAAQDAAATAQGHTSLFSEALASADRALRVNARFVPALFNRALILEHLGLANEAARAWQRYVDADPSSPWANEAREHLRRAPRESDTSRFRRELPRFARAVAAHDDAAVRAFVAEFPQECRTWGEAEWLGQWADALLHGDTRAADDALALARASGNAIAAQSGEQLLRDAVATIDRANADERRALADAHATYRRARIVYSRGQPRDAEPELRRAASAFAAAHSPMAFVARLFAACAAFDQQQDARAELAALRDELPPAYPAMRAQVERQLGLAAMTDGDWSGAEPLLDSAQSAFHRLGERGNAAFADALLADALASLGRRDASWAARIRSFAALGTQGQAINLAVSLGDASRMDLRAGHLDPARALLALELDADRDTGDDALVADALVRQAVLASRLGDSSATTIVREAASAAARIADAARRARALADVDFADGAVSLALRGDAATPLTRAIETYRARALPLYLPEALLLRARNAMTRGDTAGAARDLDDGIAALARHPIRVAGSIVGTGVLDAGDALFDEAIALALARDDRQRAFALAEKARSGNIDVVTLQARLRGSNTAVIELALLPREVVAFCVTASSFDVARGDREHLYDVAVRPFSHALDASRAVVFVAEPPLDTTPFAALEDAHQHALVERVAVARAARASDLQPNTPPRVAHSLAAVMLPSGAGTGFAALPGAANEIAELRPLYANVVEVEASRATFPAFVDAASHADVVHLAGHTAEEPDDGAALVFAGRRVHAASIASTPIRAQLVVLAGCNTLRAPDAADARALSLGAAFAAAGARDVIGTLTPVADADAHALFLELHRELQRGVAPIDALREVQRQRLRGWQSLALLTNHVP
ncbi:MAG: CHAT domain-containing protein [Acidobacteria bacterium]|nr:CHAT domain-containing protein [Acidobacteriota bacterium]MBV9476591.1 CHAT domain-containing protein [Acidobacteriota bacterium]